MGEIARRSPQKCRHHCLRVGFISELPPFSFDIPAVGKHRKSQIVGFDVSVFREAARLAGYNHKKDFEFKTYRYYDDLIPALLSGEVDLIGSNTWITEERKQNDILFTIPFYTTGGLTLTYRKGEYSCPPLNVESLLGKRLGFVGAGEALFFRQYIPERYYVGHKTFASVGALIQGLRDKEIDVVISEIGVPRYLEFIRQRSADLKSKQQVCPLRVQDLIDEQQEQEQEDDLPMAIAIGATDEEEDITLESSVIMPTQAAFATLDPKLKCEFSCALYKMWINGTLKAIKDDWFLALGLSSKAPEVLPCAVSRYFRRHLQANTRCPCQGCLKQQQQQSRS